MHPLQRIGRSKRQRARQHLVQADAQRVEIAASIHRAVHAPGLFRRHIGKRAGNDLRRRRRLPLLWKLGRDSEAREPYVAAAVHQHIRGLDVLMNEAAAMNLAEC